MKRCSLSILLLLASVNCIIRTGESSYPPYRRFHFLDYPDIFDEHRCSEVAEIRDDVRALKSLVEGLRQKVDPDFKPSVNLTDGVQCAEGFEYVSEVRGCYKVIMEKQTWSSAMEQCQGLNTNAHLISIESREENEAVTKYLIKKFASRSAKHRCHRAWHAFGNTAFWTSGQLANMSDCSSGFVWKTTGKGEATFSYTQWADGEPNCNAGREKCAEIFVNTESFWNDAKCDVGYCAICEYALKSDASTEDPGKSGETTESPGPWAEQSEAPDESSGF